MRPLLTFKLSIYKFLISSKFTLGFITCPSGNKGTGGICRCDKDGIWTQGAWIVYCNEGLCKAKQSYKECLWQKNNFKIGDGSFCWDQERHFKCQTTSGNLFIRFVW